MKITISQGEHKFTLIGEFEVGKSGHYEQRVLCTTASKKKAEALKKQFETK